MTAPATAKVAERNSGAYEATLLDEDDVAIVAAAVDSITLTLIDVGTRQIINGRSQQDVLNANGGTLHATSGLFRWEWEPADTVIVGRTLRGYHERHLATFTVTWDGGAKQMQREVVLLVKNLRSVPHVSIVPNSGAHSHAAESPVVTAS